MTPYLELMRTLKSHQIHGSFLLFFFFFFFFVFFFFCFQVGLFGPVNPLGHVKPVSLLKYFYWTGLFLQAVNQYLRTFFHQKLTTSILESAKKRE